MHTSQSYLLLGTQVLRLESNVVVISAYDKTSFYCYAQILVNL